MIRLLLAATATLECMKQFIRMVPDGPSYVKLGY